MADSLTSLKIVQEVLETKETDYEPIIYVNDNNENNFANILNILESNNPLSMDLSGKVTLKIY